MQCSDVTRKSRSSGWDWARCSVTHWRRDQTRHDTNLTANWPLGKYSHSILCSSGHINNRFRTDTIGASIVHRTEGQAWAPNLNWAFIIWLPFGCTASSGEHQGDARCGSGLAPIRPLLFLYLSLPGSVFGQYLLAHWLDHSHVDVRNSLPIWLHLCAQQTICHSSKHQLHCTALLT